jgi:hypothetical protein
MGLEQGIGKYMLLSYSRVFSSSYEERNLRLQI